MIGKFVHCDKIFAQIIVVNNNYYTNYKTYDIIKMPNSYLIIEIEKSKGEQYEMSKL